MSQRFSTRVRLRVGRYRRSRLLARLPKGRGVGAEVGSWRGDFAWEILHRVRPEQLILIDPWRHHAEESYEWAMYGGRADGGQAEMDRVYDAVLDRFTKEIDNERVVVRRESSIEAATELADEYLDWVYI